MAVETSQSTSETRIGDEEYSALAMSEHPRDEPLDAATKIISLLHKLKPRQAPRQVKEIALKERQLSKIGVAMSGARSLA